MSSDFLGQQIPFNMSYNQQLKENGLNYTFKNDLGDNIVSSYSFYDIFSPFNIINYIFPSQYFPYLVGYILMLKFAFTGLFAFLFLNNVVKKPKLAFVGALLYSFSGFQIVNLFFYHFHDVVVFFPLLLLALDKLMMENKKGFFALILGLCIIVNYVFAFGEILFLCIYFIVNVCCKRYKISKKNIIHGIIESLIGLGISAFVLIPSAIEILGNPEATYKMSWKEMLFLPLEEYLKIFQSLLLPPDIYTKDTFILFNNVLSRELCLPFVSIILVIMWIINKPKDVWNILIYVSLLFMLIRVLNNSFMMFSEYFYARWYFMPILILALASIKGLENKKKLKSTSFIMFVIVCLYIFSIITYMYYKYYNVSFEITDYSKISLALAGASIILAFFAIWYYFKKDNIIFIVLGISAWAIIAGNNYVYGISGLDANFEQYKIMLSATEHQDIIDDDSFYRVDYFNWPNSNLWFNNNGISSYISTMHPSLYKIYKELDLLEYNITKYTDKQNEFKDVVGTKYLITINIGDKFEPKGNYEKLYRVENFVVYKNLDYRPIGYTYNKYISLEEYKSLPSVEEKVDAYKESLILDSKYIEKYKDIINNGTVSYADTKLEKSTVISNIHLEQENLVFYAIPYDRDFEAYVNNEKAEIIEVGNGFMAVKANAGDNKIVIKYKNTYIKTGIIIGIISIICLIIYVRKKK